MVDKGASSLECILKKTKNMIKQTNTSKALEKGYDPDKCYVQLKDVELVQGKLDFARESIEKPDVEYYRFLNVIEIDSE